MVGGHSCSTATQQVQRTASSRAGCCPLLPQACAGTTFSCSWQMLCCAASSRLTLTHWSCKQERSANHKQMHFTDVLVDKKQAS